MGKKELWDHLPDIGEINPKTGKPYVKSKKYRWESIGRNRIIAARPEIKAKISAKAKERQGTPEAKAKISEAAKKAHARPEVKEKRKAVFSSAEYRRRHSTIIREALSKPQAKANLIAAAKARAADPHIRARHKEAMKEAYRGRSVIGYLREFKEAWIYYFKHPQGKAGGKLGFSARLATRARTYLREGWGKDVGEGLWMSPRTFKHFDLAFKVKAESNVPPYDIEQQLLNKYHRPVNEIINEELSIDSLARYLRKLFEKHQLTIVEEARKLTPKQIPFEGRR